MLPFAINPFFAGAILAGIPLGYFLAQPKRAALQDRFFVALFIALVLFALFAVCAYLKLISSTPGSVFDFITAASFVVQWWVASVLIAGRLSPPYRPMRWRTFTKAMILLVSTIVANVVWLELLFGMVS